MKIKHFRMDQATGGDQGGAGGGSGGTGDGGAAAAASGQPWFGAMPAGDVRTWVEAKGFQDLPALAQSAYNLEKTLGFSKAGRTVVLPDDKSTPEERAAFLERMGVPKEATGYKFDLPEGDDGSFAKEASAWLHEAGVSQDGAAKLYAKLAAYSKARGDADAAAYTARQQKEGAEIRAEWGGAMQANEEMVNRAAAKFMPGKTDVEKHAALAQMSKAMGPGWTMRFMQSIGAAMGEHGHVQGDRGSGSPMTPAQAKQRIAEVMSDKDWKAAYMGGGQKEATELRRLNWYAEGNSGEPPTPEELAQQLKEASGRR